MKRYLLPLILIFFLTFVLFGDCWVAGYDQRIKLTTDHTKIDAGLSDFPVTAFFTGAQSEEIFVEFDADADFDRGQFTLSDDTLLYAEKELFDDSAELAIYHIKVPAVSSSAGTDIYFYYDDDAGHNTSYIGIVGSATATEVWVDYAAVYHMVDVAVDIGAAATVRGTGTGTNYTFVNKGNPATTSGKIYAVQTYFSVSATGVKIFICSADGNNLTSKDIEVIGNVGTETQTLDVDLDVEIGDYIGIYWNSGSFRFDNTGGDGIWSLAGDHSAADGETFDLDATRVCSVGTVNLVNFVRDSTSNNHDGTKTAENNPNQVSGLNSAYAQEHIGNDESNSDITITDHADFDSQGDFTIMAVVYADTFGDGGDTNYECGVLDKDDGSNRSWKFFIRGEEDASNKGKQAFTYDVGGDTKVFSTNAISVTTWTQVGISFDNTAGSYVFYKDGVADGTASVDITPDNNGADVSIGGGSPPDQYVHDWDGKIGEVRYSDTNRSAAWFRGEYNSLWDNLLTYGREEVLVDAIFFGTNF